MTIADFLNLLLPIYALMIALVIGVLIFKKSRAKGKIPCMILQPFKRYSVEYVKPEGNSVKPKGAKRPTTYETNDFYREEKSWLKFWRLPKEVLIFGLNAKRALSWKKRGDNELESLWSDKETEDYIAKMVAKARAKGQLISNTWAIMILVAIMIVGFIVFMGFNRIGVF